MSYVFFFSAVTSRETTFQPLILVTVIKASKLCKYKAFDLPKVFIVFDLTCGPICNFCSHLDQNNITSIAEDLSIQLQHFQFM